MGSIAQYTFTLFLSLPIVNRILSSIFKNLSRYHLLILVFYYYYTQHNKDTLGHKFTILLVFYFVPIFFFTAFCGIKQAF